MNYKVLLFFYLYYKSCLGYECNIFGSCIVSTNAFYMHKKLLNFLLKGQFIHSEGSIDKNSCLELCKNEILCTWFSYNSIGKYCDLFESCPEIDEETLFISGQKECPYGESLYCLFKEIFHYLETLITIRYFDIIAHLQLNLFIN